MKNPTRWVDITMRKATRGVGEAGHWLKDGAMGLRAGVERTMAKAPPLAIEAFTIWIRHLILAAPAPTSRFKVVAMRSSSWPAFIQRVLAWNPQRPSFIGVRVLACSRSLNF